MPVNSATSMLASEATALADAAVQAPNGRLPEKTLSMEDTVPTGLLGEERRLLNQFMQQQFEMLNQAREQLLTETRESLVAEKAHFARTLDERQQELERQERLLAVRVQELQKRE